MMNSNLKTKLDHFFFAPGAGRGLSVLRIGLGLMVFIKGLFLYPHIDELYGQFGYLQAPLMESIGGGNFSSWSIAAGVTSSQYSMLLHFVFSIYLLSALTFAAGFFSRFSNVSLWATQTLLFHTAWVSAYGVDAYTQNFLFMMMFLPMGRFWSWDATRPGAEIARDWVCTFGWRCLQVYVLITYVDAGVSKAMGVDWWNGSAIWSVLHLPEFNHINFFWMASFPLVPKFLGWSTLFIETFYIVGVWIPGVGRLWALAIVSMHLVIAGLIGLPIFGVTLAIINTVLFLWPLDEERVSNPAIDGRNQSYA